VFLPAHIVGVSETNQPALEGIMATYRIISVVQEDMSFKASQFLTFSVTIPVGAHLDLGPVEAANRHEARNKAKLFCRKNGFIIRDVVTESEFSAKYERERSRHKGLYSYTLRVDVGCTVPVFVVTKKGHDRLVTRHDDQ
jgi:hypothetical protein